MVWRIVCGALVGIGAGLVTLLLVLAAMRASGVGITVLREPPPVTRPAATETNTDFAVAFGTEVEDVRVNLTPALLLGGVGLIAGFIWHWRRRPTMRP